MNVFGHKERSWRKTRKRAVSPIIATILLVAITVVLAAVLYVLISGLTHGPGNTPIGTAFAAGAPTAGQAPASDTGAASPGTCTAASTTLAAALKPGEWTYTLTVESSTVTFGGVGMEVKAPSGSVIATAGSIYVVTVSGAVAACQTFAAGAGFATTSGWIFPTANGVTSTTSVSTLYTIVIDFNVNGGTNTWSGAGNTFNAFGTGSYSGTTQAQTLP